MTQSFKNSTGMKVDYPILITGSAGTGKTNALMNYIGKTTFKHIFLCHKKPSEEILYNFLIEQCGDSISVYNSLEEFPECTHFPDNNTEDKFLVIMDECICNADKASVKKICDYLVYSRRKGITTVFITQSYYDTPTYICNNIMYLLLLSINGKRDLQSILEEQNMEGITKEKLKQIYKCCTEKRYEGDMPFMKINCSKCPINEKFSRNFLQYIQIDK